MSIGYYTRLGGVTLSQLHRSVDYQLVSEKDRLELAHIICESDFFPLYFDYIYNPHLNKQDELSEDNNVCKFLEKLADYILLSTEEKERRSEGDLFSSRDLLNTKLKKELTFSDILTENSDLNDIILHNIDKSEYVDKTEKLQITQADLDRNDEMGRILNRYYNLYINIDSSDKLNNYKKSRLKGYILEDMRTVKEYYVGDNSHNYNNMEKEEEGDDFQILEVNMNDKMLEGGSINITKSRKEKVEGLLQYQCDGLDENNPLSFLYYDLENLLKTIKFSKREKQILERYRKGFTLVEIAEELDVSKQYVHQTKNNIIKKIKGAM